MKRSRKLAFERLRIVELSRKLALKGFEKRGGFRSLSLLGWYTSLSGSHKKKKKKTKKTKKNHSYTKKKKTKETKKNNNNKKTVRLFYL